MLINELVYIGSGKIVWGKVPVLEFQHTRKKVYLSIKSVRKEENIYFNANNMKSWGFRRTQKIIFTQFHGQ